MSNKVEKNNWIQNMLWWFSESLSKLFDNIKGTFDNLLVNLWLKEKEEINETKNQSKEEQKKLQYETIISSLDIYNDLELLLKEDNILSEKKEQILENIKNKILSKNKDISKLQEEILTEIKNEKTSYEKINKNENKIKNIIKEIIQKWKKYTISEIIKSYEEIKWENKEKEPTQEEVLEKLEKSE